jgi:hypothetical protein
VEPNNSRSAAQALSGPCTQVSGTFLNDASTQRNDYFRMSIPAGKTVTALLNGLTVDYDLYLYNAAGTQIAASEASGTSADQVTWTNGGTSAADVYVLVWRYSSTRNDLPVEGELLMYGRARPSDGAAARVRRLSCSSAPLRLARCRQHLVPARRRRIPRCRADVPLAITGACSL